eukprot:683071-Pleurochrysis_carterae.AAC.1
MVNTPTQREPPDNKTPPFKIPLTEDSPQLAILRINPRLRLKHHHTPQRTSGSGRTPEATVPS